MIGEIFLARTNLSDELVVLKKMPKSNPKFDRKKVNKEILAGKLVNHPNIVQLLDHFETDDHVCLVLEYVDGMDLYSMMVARKFKVMPEKQIRKIMNQLVDALLHCHSKGIIHRDVKLDNILMDRHGNVKLCDFGLCDITPSSQNTLLRGWVGSLEYAAPEILHRIPYNGPKVDVWSAGVVLFALLYGEFPFFVEDFLKTGVHPALTWPDTQHPVAFRGTSDCVKGLVTVMLDSVPDRRISLQSVFDHEWFCKLKTANNASS